MLQGDNGVFYRVLAADRGAVLLAKLAAAGAGALDKGQFLRFLQVGRTGDFAAVRSGSAGDAFEFQAGDYVGRLLVAVCGKAGRIDVLEAGGKNDSPDLIFQELRLLIEIDSPGLAGPGALLAFPSFQEEAVFRVDGIGRGNGLGIENINGFAGGQVLVVGIRNGYRAVLGTDATTRAFLLVDKARLLPDFDAEITGLSRDILNLGPGDDPDVGRPTGLYQLRRQDSDGAVVGGKGLVQPGHDAADGGRSFNQIDIEPGIGKVHGCLDPCDPTADNHHGANGIFLGGVTHQFKKLFLSFVASQCFQSSTSSRAPLLHQRTQDGLGGIPQ
jgi:hypothetical protein